MSTRRNPVYVFKNKDSIGIYDIPLEAIVHIADFNGHPSVTQLINKSLLGQNTTMEGYIATPSAYQELDRVTEYINELLDVDLDLNVSSGAAGYILMYNDITKMWENTNTLDGGTFTGTP